MAKARKTKRKPKRRVVEFKTWKYEDLILPKVKLPNPCPVSIEMDEETVYLQVGPRQLEFDRKTGKLAAAGTWTGWWVD